MNSRIINERLGEEITNSGLTTAEIARRVGVSPEMITQYKTTKKLPKLDTFARICRELDIDANYVLGLIWRRKQGKKTRTSIWIIRSATTVFAPARRWATAVARRPLGDLNMSSLSSSPPRKLFLHLETNVRKIYIKNIAKTLDKQKFCGILFIWNAEHVWKCN